MLHDVQARVDGRNIPLNQAGVSDLKYPMTVSGQSTVGVFCMSVGLPGNCKGTHMSRFIEVLASNGGEVSAYAMPWLLSRLKSRLGAESARVEVKFPFFVRRSAPVSGASALMDYECSLVGESGPGWDDVVVGVRVPVTSLCPCSKEISDYGAHNQRGEIEVRVRCHMPVGLEELLNLLESCGSSQVYPLLKRADERHVTMQAYDNPVFVEDIVRNAVEALRSDGRITWFDVRAKNAESIHNHSAYAYFNSGCR
jgi:GTP cyclohydrolase I